MQNIYFHFQWAKRMSKEQDSKFFFESDSCAKEAGFILNLWENDDLKNVSFCTCMKTNICSTYFGMYKVFLWHIWSHSESCQSKHGVIPDFSFEENGCVSTFWVPSPCKAMSTNHVCCSLVADTPPEIQNHYQKQFSSTYLIHLATSPLLVIPSLWGKWCKCLLTTIKMKHYANEGQNCGTNQLRTAHTGSRGHLFSFMKLCCKSQIESGRGVQWKVFAGTLRGSILKLGEIKLREQCFEANESI